MTRITNVDTLSALLDRLIVENIKLYFFQIDGDSERVTHQSAVISEIKARIDHIFNNITEYRYLSEKRTFSKIVEDLTHFNIEIGQADRAKLELIKQELRARTANEGRAATKNEIDSMI